ncbi:hypothetical protein N7456_001896 [Penicillium angulare]|uniref:Uncharacterized protein n=1 Tax=Penicillium angulare TaxID=116970 RepID=A0A9W9G8H0_9EURO|nr:hypothetical protein N7456_001896 [Penicillium angulare]
MGSKHKGSDSQKHDKAAPKQLAAGRRRRQSRSPVREFEMPEKKKTKKDEKRRKKSEFESVTSFPTKTEVPHEAEIKLEPEPKEPESKEPEPKEPEPKEHESDELFKLIWDPEKSYVGEAKLPKEREIPRPPRRQRYQAPPGQPILSRQEIPSEWKWDEWDRDLDPNASYSDLEAQIQRCKERIEDGILPFIFKDRLSELESSKAAKDDLMAKHPGKSFEVAQSLDNLLFIKKSLEKKDTYKQLSNVRALIKAYKSGKLDWYPGLVTYWSHGKQLCQPRPFSWKEFYLVNRKHDGWESFWVEGLNGPGPSKQLVKIRTFVANVPPQRNSFLRCFNAM